MDNSGWCSTNPCPNRQGKEDEEGDLGSGEGGSAGGGGAVGNMKKIIRGIDGSNACLNDLGKVERMAEPYRSADN